MAEQIGKMALKLRINTLGAKQFCPEFRRLLVDVLLVIGDVQMEPLWTLGRSISWALGQR